MPRATFSFVDYNREPSAVSVRVAPVGDFGDWVADLADLQSSLIAVTLGLNTKAAYTALDFVMAAPNAAAVSPQAQRERKWSVEFFDTINFKRGSFEIPTADLSLLAENSEYMNIATGAGATLVDDIQSIVRSIDGNPITVTGIKHVGRNI